MKVHQAPAGYYGVILLNEDNTISQIGLTPSQSKLLEQFLGSLSEDNPLVKLPKEYDLILKEEE